jgi:hypothetical protein
VKCSTLLYSLDSFLLDPHLPFFEPSVESLVLL